MAKKTDVLLELVQQYDKLRTEAKQAEKDQKECADKIKTLLGDAVEAPVPGWKVTYKYDKDKKEDVFDEEKMQKKAPAEHVLYCKLVTKQERLQGDIEELTKKFTKVNTTPGARKLIIACAEEE